MHDPVDTVLVVAGCEDVANEQFAGAGSRGRLVAYGERQYESQANVYTK
jgi:hypothetical protein